jgi:hypothetical protein
MTRSRQTADWGSRAGLAKIVPSSVAVGSGTGSASTTGLVTFSGCSSVSLNNAFSSAYSNYKILITATASAGFEIAYLRLRLSGSDITGANYAWQKLGASGSSTFPSRATGQTTYEIGYTRSGSLASWCLEIFSPNIAETTKVMNFQSDPVSGTPELYFNVGVHSLSTAYDGITFYPGSGTMTGTITVLGYNN